MSENPAVPVRDGVILPPTSKSEITRLEEQLKALNKHLDKPVLSLDVSPGGAVARHELVRDRVTGQAIQSTAQLIGIKTAQLEARQKQFVRSFSKASLEGKAKRDFRRVR